MNWQPLDFEKPIFELERRLEDLKNHSDAHDVDLDSAVKAVEEKLRETRREIYGSLTAWQRVQIARHTQRPFRHLAPTVLGAIPARADRACVRTVGCEPRGASRRSGLRLMCFYATPRFPRVGGAWGRRTG